jgi:hypothetical protein
MIRPLVAFLFLPTVLVAQVRMVPDPMPGEVPDGPIAGAQVMQRPSASPRRPVASQFDSAGDTPLGIVGDTVTVYYFPDGANLTRSRHARITRRQRFLPPQSWRAACDAVAHPGWFFSLDAPATSSFAVVIPGRHEMPVRREPPPLARAGAAPYYKAWTDSVWQRYADKLQPKSEREHASLWYSFHTEKKDALWSRIRPIGVRGPNGHNYAVFSVWLRDDQKDGTPNTTGTWVVDAWGRPVARASGNVDIYGTTDADGDGVEEVVTSSGLIRFDGVAWRIPTVYPDEPCLLHRVMPAPPGWRP